MAAFALAALGAWAYLFDLEIQSGREQLSNRDSESNRRVEEFRADFGVDDPLILIVAAGSPDEGIAGEPPGSEVRRLMKRVARGWAERLRSRPDLFPEVVERFSGDDMGPLAMLYLPEEEFDAGVDAISRAIPDLASWAEAPGLAALFTLTGERLETVGGDVSDDAAPVLEAGIAQAEGFFGWLGDEIAGYRGARTLGSVLEEGLSIGDFDAEGYLFVAEGRSLVVPAAVLRETGEANEYGRAIEFAWRAVDEALAGLPAEHGISAGLAGLPALRYEEMEASRGDFTRSAIIALVLVSALFVWAFKTLVRPLLAALCLCLSIAMTFGIAWLLVGHLNLISMVFAVILVVLGIDFAIHIATHYERALIGGADPAKAVSRTLGRIGGALWMGGVTTSAAFLSAALTDSPGLSELGIIAGGGLLACAGVMFFVYPAMLYLVDRRHPVAGSVRAPRVEVAWVPGRTVRVLCVVAVGLAAFGYLGGEYGFDTNLLALQPKDGRAARWQSLLLGADDRTQFAVATFADRASLEQARARLAAEPGLILRTESVFPDDEPRRRKRLAELCADLEQIEVGVPAEPSVSGVRRALFGLRQTLRRLAGSTPDAEQALDGINGEVDRTYRALSGLETVLASERLARIQSEVVEVARSLLDTLKWLSCPPAFEVALAPAPLRQQFVGSSGRFALFVYPAENTWDREGLDRFVSGALALEPGLFDGVVNFQEDSESMIVSFARASVYSLVAVVLLVFGWCRSWRQTALVLFPLVTSIGLLLAVMRYSPWPLSWNFANLFALPILIGVGVDSGIHLTRAWKRDAATYRGAVRAVLVSSVTTLIGFGILSSSRHQGVRSLGLLLTIGIGLVLITSLVLLPAVMQVATRLGSSRLR